MSAGSLLAALSRPADAPDAELLARYAAGRDDAAFAQLVRRHGPMVRAVCRRLAPADADDAFQATFLLLSQRAGRLRSPERLGPWLHGVARRVAGRAARRRRRERTGHLPEVATADPPADDLAAAVWEEVGRLPEGYRTAVRLCDLEGMSRRAAAERLGVPESTLSNRLTRARALLGRRLLRRSIGPAVPAVGAGLVPGELVAATVAAVRTPLAAVLALTGGGFPGWPAAVGLVLVGGLLLGRPAADPPPAKPAADPTPVVGEVGDVGGLALTPDGRHLYVAQVYRGPNWKPPVPPNRITVFDTATWQVVRRLAGPEAVCGPVLFHPDGQTAYVVHPPYGTSVHRVEVKSWKTLGVLDPDLGFPSVRLSPDGRLLATLHHEARIGKPRLGQPALVTLRDATTLARLRELPAVPPLTRLGGFKPDGSVLAVVYAGDKDEAAGVVEFDPLTGAERRRLPVTVPPPGRPVIVDALYTPDGRHLTVIGGAATPVVGFPNQRTLSGGAWRLDDRRQQLWPHAARDAGDYYTALAVSPDGRRVYFGGQGHTQFNLPPLGSRDSLAVRSKVQAWRTGDPGRIEWSADGEYGHVTALCPLPNGERLVVADVSGVWLFDAATGRRRGGLLTLPWE